LVQKVHQARSASRDHRVTPAPKVRQACLENRETKARRATSVLPVLPVTRVQRVIPVGLVRKVILALPVKLVLLGCLGRPERRVQRGNRASLVLKGTLEMLAHLVRLALRAFRERKEIKGL
jgi:hypothetical protein